MKRSKKIFAALSVVFVAMLIYTAYDMSKRTTFPGSKSHPKDRLKKPFSEKDSLKKDSLKSVYR
ncbi:MAG: hypothetical protein JST69_07810 [Bacteroidetes bacterium]|nr:hypothetical protein [Bacteroidota bacterium]